MLSSTNYGKCELDSHADTTVAGSNCTVLHYTGKECDVSPFRDDFEPIKNVPIVTAATAWQSPSSGQTYILVFNEALWMGDTMDSSLINPNQLRHFGTYVQDNPSSAQPLFIMTEDLEFSMNLSMAGTIIYADTHTPTSHELATCPHIQLTSPTPWDPNKVTFPRPNLSLDEVVNEKRRVSVVISTIIESSSWEDDKDDQNDPSIFDLASIQRRIASMMSLPIHTNSNIPHHLQRDEGIDPGSSDAPIPPTFSSSDRHSDVDAQTLSERWGIGLTTAAKTLKTTTQRFTRSAILPLGRRYRTDRLYSQEKHFLAIGPLILWMDDANHLMAKDMLRSLQIKPISHAFTLWIPKGKLVMH